MFNSFSVCSTGGMCCVQHELLTFLSVVIVSHPDLGGHKVCTEAVSKGWCKKGFKLKLWCVKSERRQGVGIHFKGNLTSVHVSHFTDGLIIV